MYMMIIVFWIMIFTVFYSYLGYGLLLWLYLKIKRFRVKRVETLPAIEPFVSLIVACFNEESILRAKIENTLQIDYPKEKLKIYFITDGSTDNSGNILSEFGQITHLHTNERKGKVAAINRAMLHVSSPLVIFCDANTFLNKECIKYIVRHYSDEQIGAVAGEKIVADLNNKNNAAGAGEGLYWRYESFLKKLDSQFYTVVGAAGELFSIRTHLFEKTDDNILLDDFIISMKICKKGYRVMYEPKAFAIEAPSFNIKEEQKRKVRIGAGAFQSMHLLIDLLNIFKYKKLAFQYISHRVLRWSVCPIFIFLIVIVNMIICIFLQSNFIYNFLLFAQVIFYAMALLGWFLANKNVKNKILYIPYYFLFMNVSLILGFFKYINNTQTVLWDKALRKPESAK
jgi:poly-beta-1,6-N-acetyl-D-glucosamine synthase